MKSTFDQLLLDQNPDALIITTPTGDVMYWTGGAEILFGFVGLSLAGRSLDNFVVSGDRLIS